MKTKKAVKVSSVKYCEKCEKSTTHRWKVEFSAPGVNVRSFLCFECYQIHTGAVKFLQQINPAKHLNFL